MKYLSLLLTLLPLATFSAQSSTLEQEFNKCKAITDSDLKRLICYDAINLSTTPESQPQVETQTTTAEPVAPVVSKPQTTAQNNLSAKEERFGLKEVREKREAESIKAKVSKVKKGNYGKLTVYLDVGQVWKQNDSTTIRVKANDVVIIKQAAFNSYLMNKQGSSRSMRVKRLK